MVMGYHSRQNLIFQFHLEFVAGFTSNLDNRLQFSLLFQFQSYPFLQNVNVFNFSSPSVKFFNFSWRFYTRFL